MPLCFIDFAFKIEVPALSIGIIEDLKIDIPAQYWRSCSRLELIINEKEA